MNMNLVVASWRLGRINVVLGDTQRELELISSGGSIELAYQDVSWKYIFPNAIGGNHAWLVMIHIKEATQLCNENSPFHLGCDQVHYD